MSSSKTPNFDKIPEDDSITVKTVVPGYMWAPQSVRDYVDDQLRKHKATKDASKSGTPGKVG